MNADIVCLGLPQWEGNYQKSTVELMKELSASHRILYVEYTRTLKDTKFPKSAVLTKKYSRNGDVINVLTPPTIIPMNWIDNPKVYDKVLSLNSKILRKAILSAMQKLDMKNPVVLNAFQPAFGTKLLGKLHEKAVYYYCYDEMMEAHWCKKHNANYEKEFLKKVKGAIVTSEGLKNTKSKYQINTKMIQNGVEMELFDSKRMKPVKNNVVGYIGTIDNRMDVPILKQSIERFPYLDFIFVGRITDNNVFKALENYKNVKFVGAKKPEELGFYLENMQVGIIPFVKNKFTKNIFPMKINQYLAFGMPVVSTDFANLEDFGDLIYQGSSNHFVEHLCRAVSEENDYKFNERISFSLSNSWKNKALELSKILQS
ncbi:glycosyltransferase [Lacihabitans sp. CCS-44]|uniref:glycosyltransferase n=1 Tax=Lacihabitans sp. CCS-44 TaxID=2487331 RepID=UPI0020CD237A|nr:glycosyltransferase [Lacihabitans sp. CCS-44]MCP9756464.1 glycosyltransferase [Lacihabitans sp. CCS-44]